MGRPSQIGKRGWRGLAATTILIAAGCTPAGIGPLLTPAEPAARTLVKGVVTFQRDGTPRLIECGSDRPLHLGTMGQGHYRYFRKRANEIWRRKREPVTAHLSGYLDRSESGGIIEQPTVLALSAGYCTEPEDPGLRDY
jgi:hypothetical protein